MVPKKCMPGNKFGGESEQRPVVKGRIVAEMAHALT